MSNPEMLRRLREDAALNPPQEDKLYGGSAERYTDYLTLYVTGQVIPSEASPQTDEA